MILKNCKYSLPLITYKINGNNLKNALFAENLLDIYHYK